MLEYYQDLKYWYKNGYANPINYNMACPLIKDMADVFRLYSLMHQNSFFQNAKQKEDLSTDLNFKWKVFYTEPHKSCVAFQCDHRLAISCNLAFVFSCISV